MFQEYNPVVLLLNDNTKHQQKPSSFDKDNSSKFFYQYIYNLTAFNKITNIDVFLNNSYKESDFIPINYNKDRLQYTLVFEKKSQEYVSNNILSIMESLKNFHIVLNYYFELLYTQENLIKSVSNRLSNTINERDLNQMVSTTNNADTLSKEKDHQVTLSKILDHTDRMNLLLSVNLSYDNNLLKKTPLPKTLLSFFETFAKITSEKTRTDSKMLTNEIFIDVVETHLMNSKNEIISINGVLKIQTNVHSKIEDRKVVIKTDKFEDIETDMGKDEHSIQVLKNYSILNNKSIDDCKFPILVSYQYTSDNEITMKLNTNNVKYANTVRLKVSLNEQSNNSFKVVTQGDLTNDKKTWDSKILNSKSGNLFILKIKDIEEISLIRIKCQLSDGKGDHKGLNVKKVHVGDSSIFKGVKYSLEYEKELLIE